MKKQGYIALTLFLLAGSAFFTSAWAASLPYVGLLDPPVIVTNMSDKPVTLSWQTSLPGIALSPARSATIPAGARNKRIVPGLFWVLHKEKGSPPLVLVDNYVYVSSLDGKGDVLDQAVLKADAFTSLSDVRKAALSVIISDSGKISLAAQLDHH